MICALFWCIIWNKAHFVSIYLFSLHQHTTPSNISIWHHSIFITCYFSRIQFANWVWQESELLNYFYLTRFITAKNEFQNRFETRSRYSHIRLWGGAGFVWFWRRSKFFLGFLLNTRSILRPIASDFSAPTIFFMYFTLLFLACCPNSLILLPLPYLG